MLVIKKINNNAAICLDENDKEFIAFGKGIGFPSVPYELKDLKIIKRKFYNLDPLYLKILNTVPVQILTLTDEAADYASLRLNAKLNPNMIFTLADHINFSVQRIKNKQYLPNPMLDEIEMLYEEEFKISKEILKFINKSLRKNYKIVLPKEELGFITLHIVNNKIGEAEGKIQRVLQFVNGVLDTVKKYYPEYCKEKSYYTKRFSMHLKYLAIRILDSQEWKNDGSDDFYEILINEDEKLEECMESIIEYIEQKFEYNLSKSERIYLLVHLVKIIKSV